MNESKDERSVPWEITAQNERLYGLDFGRGFAALLVLFAHWQHFFFVGGNKFSFDWNTLPFFKYLEPLYYLGHHGVGYFFMLSGFIFYMLYGRAVENRAVTCRKFFILRLSRIYPLHAATLAATAIAQSIYFFLVGEFYVYGENNIIEFVEHGLLIASWFPGSSFSFNGPAWSLSIEFGLYLIFFIIAFLRLNRCWVCLLLLAWSLPATFENIHNIRAFSLSHFFLGGLCYFIVKAYMNSVRRSRMTDSIIVVFTSLLLAGTFHKPFYLWLYWESSLFMLTSFPLSILALIILEKPLKKYFRNFRLFGDLSFSVYLIHFPLQLFISLGIGLLGYNAGMVMCEPLLFALYFIALYSLGYLSFRYFERPVQQYFRKLLSTS